MSSSVFVQKTQKIIRTSLCILILICMLASILATQLPLEQLYHLPNQVELSLDDLQNIQYKNIAVNYTQADDANNSLSVSIGNNAISKGTLHLKAFGLFPLKKIKAKVYPKRMVFAGGYPIGVILNSSGILVVDSGSVTVDGIEVQGVALQKGDIIKKINGKEVLHIQDLSVALNPTNHLDNHSSTNDLQLAITNQQDTQTHQVLLHIERNGKEIEEWVTPIFDTDTKEYKLGIWVKDKIAGLGTVSYVKPNGKFGALGHAIIDSDTNKVFPCFSGKVYDAKIIGCEKGIQNKPGSLKGVFSGIDKQVGTIQKNNKYGIFGILNQCDKNPILYDVASRLTIKPGKATILTTVDDELKEYKIDIIKASKQKAKDDKGMVIKVTDKDLLKKTGGILQGMSGSPIIQNNKIVGALTHIYVIIRILLNTILGTFNTQNITNHKKGGKKLSKLVQLARVVAIKTTIKN